MSSSRALPVPQKDVVAQPVADGAVLFSAGQEVYFGLNTIGSRIWSLLPPVSTTLDEVVAALSQDFPEVPPEVIAADVAELLADLEELKLVVPQSLR